MIYLKGKGWGSWNDQPWGGGGWPRYYKPSHATEAQKKDLLVRIYVLAGLTIIWFLVTTYIIYDPQLNIIGKAFYDFDLWRIKNFN